MGQYGEGPGELPNTKPLLEVVKTHENEIGVKAKQGTASMRAVVEINPSPIWSPPIGSEIVINLYAFTAPHRDQFILPGVVVDWKKVGRMQITLILATNGEWEDFVIPNFDVIIRVNKPSLGEIHFGEHTALKSLKFSDVLVSRIYGDWTPKIKSNTIPMELMLEEDE